MEAYVPSSEQDAYREVAAVLDPKQHHTLADLIVADPAHVQPWFLRHVQYADNPVGTVVDRAREYFLRRREGARPPGDVSPHVYDGLANWYAATVRPHAPQDTGAQPNAN